MDKKLNVLHFSEINRYAIQSYCAIHNIKEEKNLGDISKVDMDILPKNITLITHGSPCTDFSRAGRQKGGDKDSGTASSLMWYSVDMIEKVKPKFVIWENVDNVLSDRHIHNFDAYIAELDEIGYNSYFKIYNSLDFNIPQSRKRVFVISVLRGVDKGFRHPKGVTRTAVLNDFLEKDVDDSFYDIYAITDKIQTRIVEKDYVGTLCASDSFNPKFVWDDKGLRKFTAREYWRLQGYSDSDFDKALNTGIPYYELYRQAGNAITYNVIYEILKSIIDRYGEAFTDNFEYISLFSGIGTFEMALRDLLL